MPGRHFVTDAEGNRYQFTGHEHDGETGYDYHGARYYNSELGRYMNVDRYAEKFYYQSSYVYAGDMPITAIDINGDSVLFYSQLGDYLGYSHDNSRYKDQNLLVIIDSKNIEAFNKEYNRKRDLQFVNGKEITPQFREAIVAGLEVMGTAYDATQISNFIYKYEELIGTKDNPRKSPILGYAQDGSKLQEQQEWGAWMVYSKNPYVEGLNNFVTIDKGTIATQRLTNVVRGPMPENAAVWLHTHTMTSKLSTLSHNDLSSISITNSNPAYDNIKWWVGQVQKEGGINYHYFDPKSEGKAINLTEKSFKNAK